MERVQLQFGKGSAPGSVSGSGRVSASRLNDRSPRLVVGQQLAGHVVEAWLGSGWEGCSYRVRCVGTGRRRVLKCYRRRPGLARAFQRRCRFLASNQGPASHSLSGQAITLVHGRRSWPAMFLEYCPGYSLDEWAMRFTTRGPSIAQTVAMCRAILRGLEQLHARGAYHGDLHTGNIILQRVGKGFRAHFVDPFPQAGSIDRLQQDDLVEVVRLIDDLFVSAPAGTYPTWARGLLANRRRDRILRCYSTVAEFLCDFERRRRTTRSSSC